MLIPISKGVNIFEVGSLVGKPCQRAPAKVADQETAGAPPVAAKPNLFPMVELSYKNRRLVSPQEPSSSPSLPPGVMALSGVITVEGSSKASQGSNLRQT